MTSPHAYYRVLSIAGSDSGGGAGIQADLKTFSALGCYGMSVITAITAQNTQGVKKIHGVPTEMVQAQWEAVMEDMGVDAIKIGMLHNTAVIEAVINLLHTLPSHIPVVLDPVMMAKGGAPLLEANAIDTLRTHLLPCATVITPNLPEAEVLCQQPFPVQEAAITAARKLAVGKVAAVVIKGGHSGEKTTSDDCVYLKETDNIEWLLGRRINTRNTHGTGCTFSSAVAAYLAKGEPLIDALDKAKRYVQGAIEMGNDYRLGKGHGPVHHFHNWWI
ncbi:MAG: bifunctional hydroxymethylpyrimidine kinase/phosphomethylpyrimidine kinase [Gammaproteobacteria bacterium]